MVSGPNLNETSIVSGGYGGPAGGIIPTSSIKGMALLESLNSFLYRLCVVVYSSKYRHSLHCKESLYHILKL